VPAAVPNYPEINTNAGCYSIHIDPSATLLVKAGFKLNVAGKIISRHVISFLNDMASLIRNYKALFHNFTFI
jgi:hypothetical protein